MNFPPSFPHLEAISNQGRVHGVGGPEERGEGKFTKTAARNWSIFRADPAALLFLQMLGTFPADPASPRVQDKTRDRHLTHACHLWSAFATRVHFDLAACLTAPAGFAIFGNKEMEKPLDLVGCRVGMALAFAPLTWGEEEKHVVPKRS